MRAVLYPFLCLATLLSLTSCSRKDTPQTTVVYHSYDSIVVDGLTRTFIVNLPPEYTSNSGYSLVIAMHGGGGEASQFESSSLLSQKADSAGFIVVYPNGVASTGPLAARTWNAGGCCDYARDNKIDDVNFIRQLITYLLGRYKINPKKVYACGHSNGGMLSYRLACEMSDKIAAIATNSCSMVVTQTCNSSRAVPVLHMHSILDTKVPYKGGVGISDAYFPPLDSVFQVWSLKDACATSQSTLVNNASYKLTEWTSCTNSVEIHYYLTRDGGHAWPGGLPGSANGDTPSTVINANDLLWEFFQHYQLP